MINDTFRTSFKISPRPFNLNLNSKILLLGSCFSDNIGHKLEGIKIDTLTNPFGTLFHPTAIFNALEYVLKTKHYNKELTVLQQDTWFHYQFHSSLKGITKESLIELIDSRVKQAQAFYDDCDTIVITFGTSFFYNLEIANTPVSNCHKTPQKYFSKHLTTIADIVNQFSSLNDSHLFDKKVILTVSPVRHIKDTIELNSVSKSILRLACHELSSKYDNVNYFPSFEIINDDLRDYRFYKDDLIHPNDLAINYIWDIFKTNYFGDEEKTNIREIENIISSLNHKPFNSKSTNHQVFLNNLLKKIKVLENKVDFSNEIRSIKDQLV